MASSAPPESNNAAGSLGSGAADAIAVTPAATPAWPYASAVAATTSTNASMSSAFISLSVSTFGATASTIGPEAAVRPEALQAPLQSRAQPYGDARDTSR